MALLQGLNARLGASQLRSTSSSTKAAPVPLLAPRPASGLLLPQHIEPRFVRHLLQTQAAVVEEAPVSSFSSLLDDDVESDEGELLYSQVPDPEAEVDESLLVTNLGVSDETVNALSKRGIHALFPVQKQVFEPIASGRDVVCRAKTGSGKTLAFALPVVESLLEENAEQRPRKGRAPRAIVLAPTRELANQVAREFASICPTIVVDSFYGGTSIGAQMRSLERGVDVMVGTPGRVIDLIERKALQLDQVRFAILDEADQMLDMGFEQDMETILGAVPAERQTLLFSATLPKWVSKVSRKFQDNPLTIDLVGAENTGKLADTITLLLQQVEGSQKINALQDLITTYATGGKSIIFVNTKARADEVAITLGEYMGCEALHGDIGQAQREKALQAFRDGKVSALVATDVAARGLDIPAVDLVVHYDVPQDNEAFLHRSGRTGRAGSRGTAVVLFTERETRTLGFILRDTKVTNAELIGAADPAEVMTQASRSVLNKMDKVDARVVDFFQPAAEKLLASEQPSRVLAAALASMAGFSRVPQPRSLLTYETGYVTLRLLAKPGAVDGVASLKMALKKLGTKAKVARPAGLDLESPSSLGKIRVVEDAALGLGGCAFDVPSDAAEVMLEVFAPAAQAMGMQLDRPRSIALDVDDMLGGSRGGGGGGGRFGRGGGGGDRFGRGGGGDRFGSRRDGGGRDDRFGGRDRDGGFRGGRDSRGGDRGGWGGRDGGKDGGRSRDGGGWDRYSASSHDDYNGGGGRGGGGRDRDGGWGRRDGGASSRNGGGNSSRYAAAAAAPAAPTWAQVSADADIDYFANDVAPAESNGNGKGAKKLTPRGGSKRSSDPAPIDDWGKW